MSRIRPKDTKPELAIRRLLFRHGLRFRLGDKRLPGRPDIVLRRHFVAVFVHGCFWHRHRGCRFAYSPKTNVRFWSEKFAKNVKRDSRNVRALRKLGWKVVVVWECQIRRLQDDPALLLKRVVKAQGLRPNNAAATSAAEAEDRASSRRTRSRYSASGP